MADTATEMPSDAADDSIDLTSEGADALLAFVARFYEGKGKNQAYLRIVLDDGTVIDKAEIILAAGSDDDDPEYELQLSGI